MKYSEVHRDVRRAGWSLKRVKGSHYIYEKDGVSFTVPYHGSKEISEPLRKRIYKEMGLN